MRLVKAAKASPHAKFYNLSTGLGGRLKTFLGRRPRMDRFGDMLFDSVLQPLGSTAYIPTVTETL